MKGEFLTVPEVAKRLRLQRTRAYEMVACGQIPAVRLSERSLRVPAIWVERLEAEALARVKEAGAR